MITKDKERTRLLDVWRQLGAAEKLTLFQFAQFLHSQQTESQEPISQQPLNLPRPESESVVKALKRLKKNYPMIDADMGLLDDASRLIMEKVTGTPDPEVIEKLEALFLERYQRWQHEKN
jgi:hypothetical protein